MKNQMVIKMGKDQFRIMAEMLEKAREVTLKIQPDDTYLIFMLRIGLLKENKIGERVDYVPTEKGLAFPRDYENLVKLLDENPTSSPSCYRGKCT
jgi:predicted transcriptional regulator